MTQENKELLLKDLCARLPYGVICKCNPIEQISNKKDYIVRGIDENGSIIVYDGSKYPIGCYIPYLRPMSSMTDEEKKKLKEDTCPNGTGYFDEKYLICPMSHYGEQISYDFMSNILEWLNAHHFDYRGLIEKGLAMEAPEDMYKTE